MKSGRKELKTLRFVLSMAIAGASGFPVGIFLAGKINDEVDAQTAQADRKNYGEMYDLMLKDNGKVMTLKDYKEPITVQLGCDFSENEKKQIVNAIQTLDEISPNLNYTILESPNYSIYAKITIDKVDALQDENALATTHLESDRKAKILYPIRIEIDQNFSNSFEDVSLETNDLLSHVVKHEMMHTLGFADLYDKKHFDKSIMWYSVANVNVVTDYTERDRYCINKIYDDGATVTVSYPKTCYSFVAPSLHEEDGEELKF